MGSIRNLERGKMWVEIGEEGLVEVVIMVGR